MKEKNLDVSVLLDYYSPVLTDKQRDVLEFYYNEDMSLAEIAEHELISRQGVRDNIKRGEKVLFELEDSLGFAERTAILHQKAEKMQEMLTEIKEINRKKLFSEEVDEKLKILLLLSEEIMEL